MIADNDGTLRTKALSLCFILQVSSIKQFKSFRKEDFHSFYQSISHAEKLLILTIVALSRRDISP